LMVIRIVFFFDRCMMDAVCSQEFISVGIIGPRLWCTSIVQTNVTKMINVLNSQSTV
jgi:hypothetical protein